MLLVTLMSLSVIQLMWLLLGVQPLFSVLAGGYSTCVRTRCSLIDRCSSSSVANELAGLIAQSGKKLIRYLYDERHCLAHQLSVAACIVSLAISTAQIYIAPQ